MKTTKSTPKKSATPSRANRCAFGSPAGNTASSRHKRTTECTADTAHQGTLKNVFFLQGSKKCLYLGTYVAYLRMEMHFDA